MVLVDSHCHLNFPELSQEESDVLTRAKDQGVQYFINIGTDCKSSEQCVRLSEKYNFLYATVGIHPHEAGKASEEDLKKIESLVSHNRVVALGEVGLDYYYEHSRRNDQLRILEHFLSQAKKFSRPLVFHVRDAFQDFFTCFRKYQDGSLRGVLHCFTGNQSEADEALKLGLYLSFTGILTFKKSQQLRKVAEQVPLEKILLETDAPFLAPEGYRGKVNEPSFLRVIAEVLAEVKCQSLETIARVTTQNCRNLFGIPALS